MAAFLGFPILGLVALEFRPDMLCALFAASGAVVIVADLRWRTGDRSAWSLSTALFAGAMLTKPTPARDDLCFRGGHLRQRRIAR